MASGTDTFALDEKQRMKMNPWIQATSSEDLCKKLVADAAVKAEVGKLRTLPYNRHDTAHTTWWALFEHANPAYSKGKYFFDEHGSVLRTGIHIEKGLTKEAASAVFSTSKAKAARLTMTKEWRWHSFTSDWKTGLVPNTVSKIAGSGWTPRIVISAGYVTDIDPESGAAADRAERHTFAADADGLIVHLSTENYSKRLPTLDGCTRLTQITGALEALAQPDFTWINLHIAAELDKQPTGSAAACTTNRLWTEVLWPLRRWCD